MWDQTERRNKFIGEAGWNPTCGQPNGHLAPSSWNLPQKAGGMSAYTSVSGSGGVVADGQLGLNVAANLSGSGGIASAVASLIVSMIATLTGSGTISAADLKAYLSMTATLTGSGSIVAALGGLANMLTTLTGAGSINATATGAGAMSATLRGYGDLTPEGIRDAVWQATLASYSTPGSAGLALSTASSGGVDLNALAAAVWAYTARTLTENPGVTPADIISALNATTIPVNVKQMNGVEVVGIGRDADKWRGTGEPA